MLLRGQDARRRSEFRSRDFSTDGAGGDAHLRIVANSFGLSHVATGHYVELPVRFAKPNGSRDADSILAKGSQGNVFLSLNRRRNLACHGSILEWRVEKVAALALDRELTPLSSVVRLRPALIAPVALNVLQA